MHTLLSLSIIIMSAIPCQSCQNYIDFGYSDYAFHVTYNDSTCHNYIWSHCSWSMLSNDKNDYEPNFNRCISKCCEDGVVYPQNWDGIRQCQ